MTLSKLLILHKTYIICWEDDQSVQTVQFCGQRGYFIYRFNFNNNILIFHICF